MPELPEVETIARGLASKIVGKSISRVDVRLPKMAISPPGVRFEKALIGEKIVEVGRRAKYVVMRLSSGRALVTSLRMTGRLVVLQPAEPDFRGTHIILHYKDGTRMAFADLRTFGRMRLVGPSERWDETLGPEPLSSAFTEEGFIGMLSGRTTPIKAFLLDQHRIAGIGNIYACEALWEAGIRPGRSAKAIPKPAVRRLYSAIKGVLTRAIDMRGSSIDDYVDAEGLQGGFQNVLAVYGKSGKPCPRCAKPIVRTVIAQRGTWWCKTCQR